MPFLASFVGNLIEQLLFVNKILIWVDYLNFFEHQSDCCVFHFCKLRTKNLLENISCFLTAYRFKLLRSFVKWSKDKINETLYLFWSLRDIRLRACVTLNVFCLFKRIHCSRYVARGRVCMDKIISLFDLVICNLKRFVLVVLWNQSFFRSFSINNWFLDFEAYVVFVTWGRCVIWFLDIDCHRWFFVFCLLVFRDCNFVPTLICVRW
jgi:hypothetical protein